MAGDWIVTSIICFLYYNIAEGVGCDEAIWLYASQIYRNVILNFAISVKMAARLFNSLKYNSYPTKMPFKFAFTLSIAFFFSFFFLLHNDSGASDRSSRHGYASVECEWRFGRGEPVSLLPWLYSSGVISNGEHVMYIIDSRRVTGQ